MREEAYIEANNYNQNLKLININHGIDLYGYMHNNSLSYSKFEKTTDGKFSPNTMKITLRFPYKTKEVFFKGEKLMYISSLLLKGYSLNAFKQSINEAPRVEGYIPLMSIVREGDRFALQVDEETRFNGQAEEIDYIRDNNGITIDISIKDRTSTLYEMKYLKAYLFRDIYLSNNTDKDSSLLHQLSYLLGFRDEELDIEDMKDSNGVYIKIPLIYLKKDELIIKDLAEAVRLTNSIFTIKNNKLTISSNSNRFVETYVFDSRNIQDPLNFKVIKSEYDKIKVTYDSYFKKELQDMWILVGQGGTLEDANIKIISGDTRSFRIDWFYNVDIVDSIEIYDVNIQDVQGNKLDFDYVIELDETGGYVEFRNLTGIDLYVKSFKIKGIPLFMQGNNQSYYPGNLKSEKILELTNKFVQNSQLSRMFSQLMHLEKCKDYKRFTINTNVAHFLEPGVKIFFDHEDYQGYLIIEKINYTGNGFKVEAREEINTTGIEDIEYQEKSYVDEQEVLSNKYLEEKGLYEKDKPLIPRNLSLEAQFFGFDVFFDPPEQNLRGHWVYIRETGQTDFNKYFTNANSFSYSTYTYVEYEVKVNSVSVNGVEGDFTEIKKVIPLQLESSDIKYLEGMSPEEINQKVFNNSSDIEILDGLNNQLTEDIVKNIIDINQNADSIQSIAQRTTNIENTNTSQATLIKQNADSIQTVAQEVETKTTADDVTTITNTAIESFAANEFRRTLGTSISIIDYSKSISDPSLKGMSLSDPRLKKVSIATYSTIIKQTSKEINLAVKKDNIVSAINLSEEGVKIGGSRIEVGPGLVVENEKVAVKDLTAENLRGRRLEGAEIISENDEKTERVYISSGRVVIEKRTNTLEEYKTYEKLVMQESGIVRCQNNWSPVVDFKLYNNNLPWSNLKVIAFIENQYDLDTGIATSREIIKEWVGDPSDQLMKFLVAGGSYSYSTVSTHHDYIISPLDHNFYSTTQEFLVDSSVKSFNINYDIEGFSYGYDAGNHFSSSVANYILSILVDNEPEQTIVSGSERKTGTFSRTLTENKTVTFRLKMWTSYKIDGLNPASIPSCFLNGTYVKGVYNENNAFDCTVQWLATGNS